MTARAWRPLLAAACAALAGTLALAATVRWAVPAPIHAPIADLGWDGRTRAWFTPRGFYDPEFDTGSGRRFSWTASRARLVFAALDRSQPYVLDLDVSAFRPAGQDLPFVTVSVDGRADAPASLAGGTRVVSVVVPARARPGLTIAIESSNTFVPGADNRPLGVMVNDVRLRPSRGHFSAAWPAIGRMAAAAALVAIGVWWCDVPVAIGIALTAFVVLGFDALLTLDAAFIGDEAARLLQLSAVVAAVGVAAGSIGRRWPARELPEWPAAVALALGIGVVKLAAFTHPQIALTDAMFQVHRAELVHQGEYFFTSLTPSPSFEFPYAVALYVAAQPFWRWFPSELDLANLLRGLSLCADALVGIAIYAVARRQWRSGPIALVAAALWPIARAPAMALGHANLTNVFGQSLFAVGLGLIAWSASGAAPAWLALALAVVFVTLGFLSHFSTLSIGLILLGAVAAALIVAGRGRARATGVATAGVLAIACAVAYGVYYSHFTALYRQTFTRVVSRVDREAATSMVADPATKLRRWITEDQFSNDYGLPGLPLAAAAGVGAVLLVRERRREGLTVVLLAWAAVWAAASALGIFSSVELRANLAAAPMFALFAAYAVGAAWTRARWSAALAAVCVLAIAKDGLQVWLSWL